MTWKKLAAIQHIPAAPLIHQPAYRLGVFAEDCCGQRPRGDLAATIPHLKGVSAQETGAARF